MADVAEGFVEVAGDGEGNGIGGDGGGFVEAAPGVGEGFVGWVRVDWSGEEVADEGVLGLPGEEVDEADFAWFEVCVLICHDGFTQFELHAMAGCLT